MGRFISGTSINIRNGNEMKSIEYNTHIKYACGCTIETPTLGYKPNKKWERKKVCPACFMKGLMGNEYGMKISDIFE